MKDNFSRQADQYAKYRPDYPAALFDFIIQQVPARNTAWDCATGNGQAAKVLAKHFQKVYASDISQKQLDNAARSGNIYYSLQPAEKTDFNDSQFDLVTVSQALHWFDFPRFYNEVKRVTRDGGVLAAWGYSLFTISPEVDTQVANFYHDIIGPYWDAERKHVDNLYQGIPFPFEDISSPIFTMEYRWTIEQIRGYINTWSAVQKFITANHFNPVDQLIEKITGLVQPVQKIVFPLHTRIGRIEK